MNNDTLRQWGAIAYSVIVTTTFSLVCLALYFREVISTQKDIALVLFGGLLVAFKDVGSYWTGSSSSSASKDKTIADIATSSSASQLPPPPPPSVPPQPDGGPRPFQPPPSGTVEETTTTTRAADETVSTRSVHSS